jgi:Mg/Co/Ni transporter MgtE
MGVVRTSKVINKTAIDQAVSVLAKLPDKPKENFALREAIFEMRQEIQSVLDRGYSYEEVAGLLSQNEVQIKAITLKQYLAEFRRKSSKKKSAAKSAGGKDSKAVGAAPVEKHAAKEKTSGSKNRFIEMPDDL